MNGDRELVARCLAEDPAAVRSFIERFERLVFSICLRMLGHRQEAEDATQESLLRAVRHLKSWDASRPLQPWITTIAVNRCRTRRSTMARQGPTYEALDVAAPAVPADDWVEEMQLAVASLRDEYRECFTLFYVEELSCQEIAERLDRPVGTIKIWLFRARKEIAAWLTSRGWSPETQT